MRAILAVSLVLVFSISALGADVIQLADAHWTQYQVVVADGGSPEVHAAARELAGFLQQVTVAEFPVVPASLARDEHQIIVGPSKALDDTKLSVDWDALGPEGFIIRTVGPKLVIAGGPGRGTINGVYTFLEDVIGCRWFTPKFSVIPKKTTLSLPPLDVMEVPAFESRFVYCGSATDAAWSARQRLNTFTRDVTLGLRADGTRVPWGEFINDPRLAGAIHYARWHVHTIGHDMLLPYAMFDEHPEYFAVVKGKRIRKGQPCMTNQDVAPLIASGAKQWIRQHPKARIISISQGDFANACQCPKCKAALEEYGISGVCMRFVNQVAEEIEKDYPNVLVDTLAYQWTRKPPKNVTMRKNVVIRYAPICGCSRHAYDDEGCKVNRSNNVYADLVEWIRISPRVWVWYYAIPGYELHPYPNIGALSRDFKRMRDAGVKGYFIQAHAGAKMVMTGGLTDLKAYLFAKLMWDPDYDVARGVKEFVTACYGAAAPQVFTYLDRIDDAATYVGTDSDFHLGCGAKPRLKTDKLAELDVLMDEAERAVADDAGVLWRVRLFRLSLQCAIMRYADKGSLIRQKAIRGFYPVARQAGAALPRDLPADR